MRLLGRLVRGLAWTALGVVAALGVTISALALFAASSVGRPIVTSFVIRFVDDAVAGHVKLRGVEVLPDGALELRGLEVQDPDGHLVLSVDHARVDLDVRRLRNKVVGVSLELTGPAVLLEEEENGGLSLARAFAPAHPSPPQPKRPATGEPPSFAGWTVRLTRLTVRDADVWWVDRDGHSRVEASGISIDGRARLSPDRSVAELRLTGSLSEPVEAPISLEVRAGLDGAALRVPVLRAQVGATVLDGMGQVDLLTGAGRAAITRAAVQRAQAEALLQKARPGAALPAAVRGDDVAFHGYAESDGKTATAALHVAPRPPAPAGAGRAPAADPGGAGDVALALRLDRRRAVGVDVDLDRLDPSALSGVAPPGRITLQAHGGAAGESLSTLRGALELSLARSTLREGTLGPATARVRVEPGRWEVRELALQAPGLTVSGNGRWNQDGAASGRFALHATDLQALATNLGRLLDRPMPALRGQALADAQLSGTARAPAIDAQVTAPLVEVGGAAVRGLHAQVSSRGPLDAPALQLEGRAAGVRSGAREVVRAVELRGGLEGDAVRLSATAAVPGAGTEPYALELAGTLRDGRRALGIESLTLGWPGTRFALAHPAVVTFAVPPGKRADGAAPAASGGPWVDQLELASGGQRLVVEGGLAARRTLDARLQVEAFELARLPEGLLPLEEKIAGQLTLDAHATGPTARPAVEATLALANGSFRTERALALSAYARWDGEARRLAATATLARGPGGRVAVRAELPLPLAGRAAAEPLSASVEVTGLAVPALLALTGEEDLPAQGVLGATATLSGTVGAPALKLDAALRQASWDDLEGVEVTLGIEAATELAVRSEASLSGAPALRVQARAPLELAAVLQRPAPTLERLGEARLAALVEVPGVELAALSGHLGVPEGLAGRLSGAAKLGGTVAAPRGTAAFDLLGGAFRGYSGVLARVEADAAADRTALRAQVSLQGQQVLRLAASLAAPVEALRGERLRTAALAVQGEIPRVDLSRAASSSSDVLLSGTAEGRLEASGTLERPHGSLTLDGTKLGYQTRPIGELHVAARTGNGATTAELSLVPAGGGDLRGALDVQAALGLGTRAAAFRGAPATASLRATRLDLGFLPGLTGGAVRTASGRLDADVTASGTLAKLRPRGTVRVEDGHAAVSEYGDWNRIALDASLDDDALEVRNLEAHRGKGDLVARASLRGLGSPPAKLTGRVDAKQLLITRAGMTVATVDLACDVAGSWKPELLDVTLTIPSATVKLPRKQVRTLQPLEDRPDIVVGRKKRKPEEAKAPGESMAIRAHVLAPGRVRVAADNPRVQLDLKADVSYERDQGEDYLSGSVETLRGYVEPIGGRIFEVQRGKVTFSGGPPRAAVLDVEATYDNPQAKVTVTISGPLASPEIRLTSQPPLDESQIALLIATGRTELKAGQGGLTGMSGENDTNSLGVLGSLGATFLFKNVLQDRLPFDTVALDSTAVRAGKYILDNKVYIGYTRRFDARPELGENTNEARVEYQITPRWTLEWRYGDAQSGGASLIWSKEY